MRTWNALLILCGLAWCLGLDQTARVVATPNYAARAGRACDNCHLDPSKWENPEQVSLRKCTLACQSCHVDPSGGGMRTASGRFYGASTLPGVATQARPTQDWDASFLGLFHRKDKKTTYTHDLPQGPSNVQESDRFGPQDTWAWGESRPSSMSPLQGRYGTLNADPVLRVGWDVRSAVLFSSTQFNSGRTKAFPMQLDVGAVLHPVEHLSLLANVGARGRSEGVEAVFDDPRTPYLRDMFVMVHELPYMAYAKAGRFTPSFGLRLDDHTAFIRRGLGLDNSLPESRVTGVEVGAAPNYPFVQASWFKSRKEHTPPSAFDPFDTDDAWGTAVNLGYRDLGWALGASFLYRDKWIENGGAFSAWGLYGALNLWHYMKSLPLTYSAEYDAAERDRSQTGKASTRLWWQELNWLAGNGVNFLAGHTWEDPDREVAYDEAHRLHLGTQFTPYSGVTIDLRYRRLWPRRNPALPLTVSPDGSDLFLQMHLWN